MNAAIILEREKVKVSHATQPYLSIERGQETKTHPIPTSNVPNNGTAQCTLCAFCAVHP